MTRPDRGAEAATRVAAIIGAEFGWRDTRQALEAQTYLDGAQREFFAVPPTD